MPALIVNLFAGPGAGKSTIAAGTFAELKWENISCELVTEFAKDLVWEKREKALEDNFYILAKQLHRILRVKDQVDIIITDAPLLTSIAYNNDSLLHQLARSEHSKLNNLNVFINRVKPYHQVGSIQNEKEARYLDHKIELIASAAGELKYIPGDKVGVDVLVKHILSIVRKD